MGADGRKEETGLRIPLTAASVGLLSLPLPLSGSSGDESKVIGLVDL